MKKLKVLHIVEALGGGVYSYFMDLTNYFGNLDTAETTIIYSDKRKEILPEKVKLDFHSKTKLVMVPMEKGLSIFDISTTIKLIKHINKIKPDIIHLHSSKMTVIGRLAYLLSKTQAKLFYTPHGYAFLRKDISKKASRLYFLIEKYFKKLGGATIACGDTEYEYAKVFGKALLIRNGIKIDKITKYYKKTKTDKLTIGILGRITFARNPDLFNKIAIKNPDIQFIWIGDGNLKTQITAHNIEVTGWFMEREEGLKKLNNIDIYLQPSLWEGLPIAVLEAMAMKKPVLATNIIGNKDVVVHGKTGYLFNTLEELKGYIQLLKDENLRYKMGEEGLKRIEQLFNCEKNFKDLEEVYKNACNSAY